MIKLYHVAGSRSTRSLWLLNELDILYETLVPNFGRLW